MRATCMPLAQMALNSLLLGNSAKMQRFRDLAWRFLLFNTP